MPLVRLKSILPQLSAVGTFMLGLGALLVGDARADASQLQPTKAAREPGQLVSSSDEVAIRMEGENIYISQQGRGFEELRLGDVPEAAYLRRLLQDAGAVGRSVSIPIGSMIVASGGGSGKGEKPKPESSSDATDPEKVKGKAK